MQGWNDISTTIKQYLHGDKTKKKTDETIENTLYFFYTD